MPDPLDLSWPPKPVAVNNDAFSEFTPAVRDSRHTPPFPTVGFRTRLHVSKATGAGVLFISYKEAVAAKLIPEAQKRWIEQPGGMVTHVAPVYFAHKTNVANVVDMKFLVMHADVCLPELATLRRGTVFTGKVIKTPSGKEVSGIKVVIPPSAIRGMNAGTYKPLVTAMGEGFLTMSEIEFQPTQGREAPTKVGKRR